MRPFPAAIGIMLAVAASCRAATIGVPENLGPWGLAASQPADHRGIYADLAEALAARTHVPIEIRFVPYGRMVQGVRTGDLDYVFALVTPTTSEAAPFSTIVAKVPMVAVARKGLPLTSLDDLRSFKEVGYLRGGSCGMAVDSDAAVHRTAQDGYDGAIRKLAAGRLDGWCSIKAGFTYALTELKLEDQIGTTLDYGAIQIGLQVTSAKKDSPETRDLSAALDGLVADGTVGRIFSRYLGQAYPP